jgi:hypothetical protein
MFCLRLLSLTAGAGQMIRIIAVFLKNYPPGCSTQVHECVICLRRERDGRAVRVKQKPSLTLKSETAELVRLHRRSPIPFQIFGRGRDGDC